MNREDIHNVVLDYLDLIENGRASVEDNLQALELILDKLALAHNFLDFQFEDADHPEAPREDYNRLRQLAERRFPHFGHYNSPEHITDRIAESGLVVGDAIDDVADIARDMYETAWCWRHASPEDALWLFRFGYESHWGEHLRGLQLYILAAKRGL